MSMRKRDKGVMGCPECKHQLQVRISAADLLVAPLQRAADVPPVLNQIWMNDTGTPSDLPHENDIPTLISWKYGGNDVLVEGSWDNWTSRKILQRTGKDQSILLVLRSGIYQYRFIVDGEWRYICGLPCISDEMGRMNNLLDVNDIKESKTFLSKEDDRKVVLFDDNDDDDTGEWS